MPPLHGPHLELDDRQRRRMAGPLSWLGRGLLLLAVVFLGLVSWLFLPAALLVGAITLLAARRKSFQHDI